MKMIENQNNSNQKRKLNTLFFEKYGKGTQNPSQPINKLNSSKSREINELEKFEKLSAFDKIVKLQNLCKEMISEKERFMKNKTQMIDKINKNCYKYYKNKICMKEIYDYCQSKKPEEHIDYVLVEEPEKYFDDKFNNIYNFLFMLRNNNKLMLKLVENCKEENFEQLSDFIVNFCYEDTINSSFIQEELMLFIYLILEQHFFEILPEEIKVDDNHVSYDIFRNKKNIIYFIVKSLTRKADIRNFLCSILVDDIIKLQGYRKYLSPDIFSQKNLEDYIHEHNDSYDEDLRNNNMNSFKPLEMLEIYPINDLEKITLDPFFEKNNVTSNYISQKIKEYEHNLKANTLNLAMIDYLNSLLKDINENKNKDINKNEIYSNSKLIQLLKIIKVKEEQNIENENTFDKTLEVIKNNYNSIVEAINHILVNLDENITSVPFIIKCISNIIEQLLNKKYTKKSKNFLSNYQKYIFKSNYFIGNLLLSSIINIDYNGIITSEVISKITTENLKIIYDIFNKLLSGKLFRNDSNEYFFYSLFNKLIIEIIPKIFSIINKIENKFKLPDIMQRLINTCTEINNNKRLNDFEYDYFFEKNEDIQYQSLCFNLENLGLLSHLINEIRNKDNNLNYIINEKDRILIDKMCTYENEFIRIYLNTKNNNQKCEYFIINRLIFNSKVENKINLILKDNLIDYIHNNNNNLDEFIFFKKCFIEVLSYININKEDSFISFKVIKSKFVHSSSEKKKIARKIKKKKYDDIFNEEKIENIEKELDGNNNFKTILFQKSLNYLKYENDSNFEDFKSQKIIFCISYIQSHLKDIPKEYIDNNYCKLFSELLKETLNISNYLNSNILHQIYNKIKEGNKLNMIIVSNCLQIKSMEKFKCIEYLYSKLLIPDKFKIQKDENDNLLKIEYIRDKANKKVDSQSKQNEPNLNNENNNIDNNNNKDLKENQKYEQNNGNETNNNITNLPNNYEINNTIPPPPPLPLSPKMELIENLIGIIPNFRVYEKYSDDILKMEEEIGVPDALKNFFRTMKILVRKEKIVKRFSKQEIDSIVIELENYILFKLYDKLYPTKESKDDIRFYKKCCRLNFIKPYNIITDKNIINEKLLKISVDYLNEINNKYTPTDKIKSISKAFAILQNSITFSSGKKELGVDDTTKPLIYVVIKMQPKNIFNNYNYCRLFLNSDLAKKELGILLTQIYFVMRIITDMKYNELIGVSEEQFGKDEDV